MIRRTLDFLEILSLTAHMTKRRSTNDLDTMASSLTPAGLSEVILQCTLSCILLGRMSRTNHSTQNALHF